jgi:hypothetical protein
LNLKQALSVCPWTAALLHLFIDKQKEPNDFLPIVHELMKSICESKENQGQETKMKIVEDAFDAIELLLPITVGGTLLVSVNEVINSTIKDLMAGERKVIRSWDIFFKQHAQEPSTGTFAQKVEDFINAWPQCFKTVLLDVMGLCPTSSLGVFFRLPSWLARLVLFILKHNTAVQYRLMDHGYRSFALFHSEITPQDPIQEGEEQVRHSIICGYNICECPAWVRDGIVFAGHSITQEHRDIVQRLSREYHESFEAYQNEGKEWWGEEEEDVEEEEEREEAGAISHSPKYAGAIVAMPPLGQKGLDSEAVGAAVEGAVAAVAAFKEREYLTLLTSLTRLTTCRHSEMQARDRETYDRLSRNLESQNVKGSVRSPAGTVRGGGKSRGGGGGVGGGKGGGQSHGEEERETVVKEVLEDLHDFRDANGVWTSDWVLQVTVKQHDGKDDEDGKRIDTSRITRGPDFRLYSVDRDLLIRVTVKNLSTTRDISLVPVYVKEAKENGEEEAEELVELKSGECFELPFPLQKEAGEGEDAWALKDDQGKTVLRLRFTL